MNIMGNIPTIALIGAVIVLLGWVIILELRIKRLLGGKDGSSLEDTIISNQLSIENLHKESEHVLDELDKLDKRLRRKIDGVRTIRFNPFEGTGQGGKQSFASAFLDEDKNGVVVSSLYTRDKVSVFAKPIVRGSSEFELSEEERSVLS